MAIQALNLVTASDDQDETVVVVNITVETDGDKLYAVRAVDLDGVEYDVRLELTAKPEPTHKQCCENTPTGVYCYSGPCKPHN